MHPHTIKQTPKWKWGLHGTDSADHLLTSTSSLTCDRLGGCWGGTKAQGNTPDSWVGLSRRGKISVLAFPSYQVITLLINHRSKVQRLRCEIGSRKVNVLSLVVKQVACPHMGWGPTERPCLAHHPHL